MNNTDKLLRAFIEASGYEIKEVITRRMLVTAGVPSKEEFINGCPIIEEVDYKVTKRVDKVFVSKDEYRAYTLDAFKDFNFE